ncbi:MAG: tRNA (adenosine(37)-N6)-threonylcarbamoyltransferase complex dimerization subunit type 1 TsaB [Planctomycetales bacterium]|nr:tRNA (adenosine(37)-N6)-threonylcarbamoyltransferase complex dimerization subunit type 1 TsaB [Planctomycetales bacterium]
MKIIALETSTQPGSIAAVEDGRVAFDRSLPTSEQTAESFAVAWQEMLRTLEWKPNSIDGIAVCEGPGSFTGLRIGITAAKTFHYVTNAAVLAPSTMSVLAHQAALTEPGQSVWCVLDAQRGEVFAAKYTMIDSRELYESIATKIFSPADFVRAVEADDIVTGTGLRRIDQTLLNPNAICPESAWTPTAATLALCGTQMLQRGHIADAWRLVPQYYRKSAAEEKLVNTKNAGR